MMRKRIVCFGEVMLRLKPPGFDRLQQARTLEMQVAGAEANVAAALAGFGHDAAMISVIPDNPLGDTAMAALMARGIDCRLIRREGDRLGLYFLETGAVQRPSRIVYDRAGSAFAVCDPESYDWPSLLAGADMLHFSGITPAVSAMSAKASWDAAAAAHELGIGVSFDGNYRKALWENWAGDGPSVLRRLIGLCSIAFINEKDLGLIFERDFPDRRTAIAFAFETLPGLKAIAATRRDQTGVNDQQLSGELFTRDGDWTSPVWPMQGIVDRIGGGDAFAAGYLSAYLRGLARQERIDFATAAAVYKHAIPGDALIASLQDIEDALSGGSLDVRR